MPVFGLGRHSAGQAGEYNTMQRRVLRMKLMAPSGALFIFRSSPQGPAALAAAWTKASRNVLR